MLILKFNSQLLAKDLCDALIDGADEVMEHFVRDAQAGLRAADFANEDAVLYEAAKIIHAECLFHAFSILESYGTGNKMDLDNAALDDYIRSSLWNPARKSLTIVGRPKGKYVNIFGKIASSKGRNEGKPIKFNGSPPDRKPKYAIQNAEKALREGGYMGRILKRHADEFISSMNPAKYFYNEERKL